MYWIYVIKNGAGKIYVGQTSDLERRLKRHNGLLPSNLNSYTKINKGPWTIVYKEEFLNRKDALKREKHLKSHAGRDWLRSILGP